MEHFCRPAPLVLETNVADECFHRQQGCLALHAVCAEARHAVANGEVQLVHRLSIGSSRMTKRFFEVVARRGVMKVWLFMASRLRP